MVNTPVSLSKMLLGLRLPNPHRFLSASDVVAPANMLEH